MKSTIIGGLFSSANLDKTTKKCYIAANQISEETMEKIAHFSIALASVLFSLACSEFPKQCVENRYKEDMRTHICTDLSEEACQKRLDFAKPFVDGTVAVHDGSRAFIGTAFVISGGRLVTNRHVIDKHPENIRITTRTMESDGTPSWSCGEIDVVVDYVDPDEDIAILRLRDETDIDLLPEPLELSSEAPLVKERVWMFGKTSRWSWGLVYKFKRDGKEIVSTMPIEHGDSGSPMVNDDGKVVGVLYSYYVKNNLSSFVSITPLVEAGII